VFGADLERRGVVCAAKKKPGSPSKAGNGIVATRKKIIVRKKAGKPAVATNGDGAGECVCPLHPHAVVIVK